MAKQKVEQVEQVESKVPTKAQYTKANPIKAALVAIANTLPGVEILVKGAKVNLLPSQPHGVNKRALAVALYLRAAELLHGKVPTVHCEKAGTLASLCFIWGGAAYCHATGKALVGEVRGSKGCTGYIKPTADWWQHLTPRGKHHSKVAVLLPYANDMFVYYAKADQLQSTDTVEAKYATMYKAMQDRLPSK